MVSNVSGFLAMLMSERAKINGSFRYQSARASQGRLERGDEENTR